MDLNQITDITLFGISLKTPLLFLIKSLFILLFVWGSVAFIKFIFKRVQTKNRILINDTNIGFIRRFIIYGIYIIGVTAFMGLIPGMEKVSNSILASAGILAVAVGLASQEALSNIVSGLFIIFSRPFRVGDRIKVDQTIDGTVKEITLRHTIIRNSENRKILVPNNKINSSTIINSSSGDKATCSFIEIGVAYTVDLEKAMDIMREEIMKHPLLIDRRSEQDKRKGTPQVVVRVIELGDYSITLRAWAWAANYGNAFVLKCDLLKSIKERFDAENIEIPYPYFNQIVTQNQNQA